MRWQTKCVIDSAKALLPFQAQLRRIKDRIAPYQPSSRTDVHTIAQGLKQIDWLSRAMPLQGASVLEIGSGWQPMIPLLFSLAGAARVLMTDQNVLLRRDTFAAALGSLRAQKADIAAALSLDPRIVDHALRDDPGMSLRDRLSELRLIYMAPCDCGSLDLGAGTLDVITSRACLEHVPPATIEAIFAESYRLLRPGGVACHLIDHSDHWEHRDKRLTPVNFLKYSDGVFRWTHINPLNYHNRLRHSQYLEMLQAAGMRLLREEHEVDERSLQALEHMPLAARFRRFPLEDLATVEGMFLSIKDRAGAR
jgi:SAM-dependent methyltransferase